MAEDVTGYGEHIPDELLSAYLDGDVEDEQTLERIDAHLAQCRECRAALGELRALVRLLGDLPEPAVPRSFALTPEMVQPANVVPGPWFVRFQPVLRLATAAAAALLVLVLGADLLLHQPGGQESAAEVHIMMTDGGSSGGASAERSAADTATEAAAANAATAAEQSSPVPDAAAPPAPAAASASPEAAEARGEAFDTPATAGSAAEASGEASVDQSAEPFAATQPADGPGIWRLAEAVLVLVVLWLLVATFALPRLRERRG